MASQLQDPLDVGQLAAQRTRLEHDYPLGRFSRLRDSLARPDGVAVVDFRALVLVDCYKVFQMYQQAHQLL